MAKTCRIVAAVADPAVKQVNVVTSEPGLPGAHKTYTQAAGVATHNTYPTFQPSASTNPNAPTIIVPGYAGPA